MGLKPAFLEAFAITVMEHEKLRLTSGEMRSKQQEPSSFSFHSPRIPNKGDQALDIKRNGLPSRDLVPDVHSSSSDIQRPLHVQVNGFGKGSSQPSSSSSTRLQTPTSPSSSQEGCAPAADSLQSSKTLASSPVPSPSCTTRNQPGSARLSITSGPSTSSRREVEVTKRKTVVEKIIKGKERNAFKFFVPGFDNQTPTQLAVAARRLKYLAEEKMPRNMITRVYGEEEESKLSKRRNTQVPQLCTNTSSIKPEYDDNTDLSDIEVKDRVDSIVTRWGQTKASMGHEIEKNAVELENAARQADYLDGFLCEDDQMPSCSFETFPPDQETCARVRPIDARFTRRRRLRFRCQFRSRNTDANHSFGLTGLVSLNQDQVSCCPLRQIEAFARTISMVPAFSIRSRIDLPIWMNRDSITEERRRCTPMQFDNSDDVDRPQPVSKSKKMRLTERSSVSSSESSSLEDSEDERKDKSYTIAGYSDKRRHDMRRAKNRKKQRRRTRRLLDVESDSGSTESLDSFYKVKLEIPKYSDIEVPNWRKLSEGEVSDLKQHDLPCVCCTTDRLETLVARKHLRLAMEERLYFEGKRQEMPCIDSDDASGVEGADLTPLLECSLTEAERAQYDRQSLSGKEPLQRPR